MIYAYYVSALIVALVCLWYTWLGYKNQTQYRGYRFLTVMILPWGGFIVLIALVLCGLLWCAGAYLDDHYQNKKGGDV